MQIDKDAIIKFLTEQDHQDKARQASDQLPDKVDTDRIGRLLSKLGVDPELLGKLSGGLGDKLGGILGEH
jgi:hypothetical protein